MENNIKQLIEYYAFNPAELKDDKPKSKLPRQVVNDSLILYTPMTFDELQGAMIKVGMEDHNPDWTDNNHCLNLNCIDVSNIDNFSAVFKNFKKTIFWKYYNNVDISLWNVSNGKYFSNMFEGFISFDCDLSRWNVSEGIGFSNMFNGCKRFNSNISGWNVQKANVLNSMFKDCKSFNQNLNNWKPVNCKIYNHMFEGCKSFNYDLSSWWKLHDFYHDENLQTEDMFKGCDLLEYIPKWYKDSQQINDWLSGKNVSFIEN